MFYQPNLFVPFVFPPKPELPFLSKKLDKPAPVLEDRPVYQVFEKIIISGNYLEHYTYEKGYWVGWPKERFYRILKPRVKSSLEQTALRDDNVRRTRIKIRRLVNSNQDLVKFMTLTFADEIFDLESANKMFNQFIKRLTRLSPGFKYLAVPEFQSSGRVHYHLLCNLPYIKNDDLKNVWGHGFVFIRLIDKVENLGSYMCKYLGKANFDSRFFRKRKFFYSFNLLKPIIITDLNKIKDIIYNLPLSLSFLLKKVFSMSFLTKYLGEIQYNQYKLSDFLKVV